MAALAPNGRGHTKHAPHMSEGAASRGEPIRRLSRRGSRGGTLSMAVANLRGVNLQRLLLLQQP